MTEFIERIFPNVITHTKITPMEFYEMTPAEILAIWDTTKEYQKAEFLTKKQMLEAIRAAVTIGIVNTKKGNNYTLFEDTSNKKINKVTKEEKKEELEHFQALLYKEVT